VVSLVCLGAQLVLWIKKIRTHPGAAQGKHEFCLICNFKGLSDSLSS
jgi:hypothetical protein